jgi:hypothetical protein
MRSNTSASLMPNRSAKKPGERRLGVADTLGGFIGDEFTADADYVIRLTDEVDHLDVRRLELFEVPKCRWNLIGNPCSRRELHDGGRSGTALKVQVQVRLR